MTQSVEGYGQQTRLPDIQGTDIVPWERGGPVAPYPASVEVSTLVAYIKSQVAKGAIISFGPDRTAIANPVIGDVFVDTDDGIIYQFELGGWAAKTDFVTSAELTTAIASLLTQTAADARYPLKTATDPYPVYLTQAEAAALFTPIGGDAQGGLRYNLVLTTGTATSGQIRFNNATLASVTALSIHESDRNSTAMTTILDAIAIGTRIQVSLEDNEEIYAWFLVSGAVVDNGSDRTVPVSFVSSSGTFVAGEVTLNLLQIQGQNSSGSGGASGLQYKYQGATGSTAAGEIRGDLAAGGAIAVHPTDDQGNVQSTLLGRLKAGAIFRLQVDAANWVQFSVTADYASGSVTVAAGMVEGAIASGATVFLSILSDAPSTSIGGSGGMAWQNITADQTATANNGYIVSTAGATLSLVAGTIAPIALVNGSNGDVYFKPQTSGHIKDGTLSSNINDLLVIPTKGAVEVIQATASAWHILSARGAISFLTQSGYRPETLALQGRLTGTYTIAQKDAQNALIGGLIDDGLWPLLDCIYLYTAANQNDSFLNWKGTSFSCTASGGQSFTAFSSQTGQVLTGFIPSTAGGNFALNSATLAVWVNSANNLGAKEIGAISGGTAQSYLAINNSGRVEGRMNGASAVLATSVNTAGLYSYTRSGATSAGEAIYKDGGIIAKDIASGGNSANLPMTELYIGGVNGDISSGRDKRFACVGGALSGSQHFALYTRLNTFFTALGL